MVLEAVEQRIDQGFALEQLVPVRIIEIGRDDRRPTAVAHIQQLKEGVDLFGFQGQVAQLIDLEEIVAA